MISNKRHAVIYIPGIGDDYKGFQGRIVKSWRLYGVMPILHEMPWMDTAGLQPKLAKLLDKIDSLTADGYRVSLIGVSAGAGAAINAFAARPEKVNGVVCICGKINRPELIGKIFETKSPAFLESATLVKDSLAKLQSLEKLCRLQSRRSVYEWVVKPPDSYVPAAQNVVVPSVGHAFTILTQALFGVPFFLRWLKMLES
jgi:pimeloyl-ACP methyl ester carboxylesterase